MEEESKIQRYEPALRSVEQPQPASVVPYEIVELEEGPDLLTYWRVLRKRQWTVLTIFFVLFTLVLIGTLNQTPIYRAGALLEIEKENPDIPTIQELFELEAVSDTYLETQYKILKSDSLARRVVDELRLDQVKEFNPPKRGWSFGGGEENREEDAKRAQGGLFLIAGSKSTKDSTTYQRVLERFKARLEVNPVKRSRLVEVTFESQDPELAARVVNTLTASHIEQNLEARWEATQKATEWLSQQLLGLKARLEKSEEELQEYARQHGLLFLESDRGGAENVLNERLRKLQEELAQAQSLRYEKESLYRLVQNGDYGSLPGVFEDRLTQDLTVRLAELRRQSAELATTFTSDYPRVKQIESQIQELERVLAEERERAARRIVNDYQAAVEREKLLRRAFEEVEAQVNSVAEKSVQYNILKREAETNKELYQGLLQRLKEAGVSAGLKASNVRVVDPANPPKEPASPKILLNLGLAVVLGLALGIGAGFLQEYLDNTLKTADDVERFLRLPALALIPSVESLNGRPGVYGLYGKIKFLAQPEKAVLVGESPNTNEGQKSWHRIDNTQEYPVLAEAFRSLRTSVLLSTAGHPPRSLLITSSHPGEGKTTISLNLAISLAQLGRRVLLIDSDMRRPCVHRALGISDSGGVVSYLTGQQDWRSQVRTTSLPGLSALVCGPVPPNPAELLSSDRMSVLMHEAMGEYDFVVLDSPPVLSVADSRILATLVEGVVLVTRGAETPREMVRRTRNHIYAVGANIIGTVLNNLDIRADEYYYSRYYRYDYYGLEKEPGGKPGKETR